MIRKLTRNTISFFEQKTGLSIKSFAKNGSLMLLSHLSGILFALITSYFFANYISKTEYGTYKYVLSISGIIGAFTLTGMNAALMRAVASGNESLYGPSVRFQLRWNSFVFLSSLLPIAFLLFTGKATLAVALFIVSISTVFLTAYNTYTAFLNGKKEFRKLATYTITGTVIYSVLIIFSILLFTNALWIIAISFASQTGLAFAFHKIVKSKISERNLDTEEYKKTIRFGKILSLNNIVKLLSDQADKFIVFLLLGPSMLAIYAFAHAIPDQIRGVFKIIPPIVFPHFAERENNATPKRFWRYLTFIFFISVVAVILYNLFAQSIFSLLFQPYLSSVPYSRILSISMIPISLTIPLSTFLNARRNEKAGSILSIFTAFIEVSVLLFGGIMFGFIGILFGKLISSSATFLTALFLVYKHNKSTNQNIVIE